MTLNPPIIDLTQSHIDSGDASEAIAGAFEYKLFNGEGFMARGVSIDIDTVIAKSLKDECILGEIELLFANDKMVDLMKNITNLKNLFQDHMNESTALLVAAAESGQLE
jgi:hypothetical protein